ncbi:MAG: DUF5131 family protein [Solirubrobacteraceae bacterium]
MAAAPSVSVRTGRYLPRTTSTSLSLVVDRKAGAGQWTPTNAPQNVALRPERLEQPLRWGLSRMVFVNSMSDLFHDAVPDAYIAKVFAVMAVAHRHIFQVLTKRPERMLVLLAASGEDVAGRGRRSDSGPWIVAQSSLAAAQRLARNLSRELAICISRGCLAPDSSCDHICER